MIVCVINTVVIIYYDSFRSAIDRWVIRINIIFIQCSLMHLPPVAAILCPCDSLIYERVGMNDYVLHNLQYFSLPQADAWDMPLTPTIRHSDLELDTHPKFQNEWQGSL